MNKENTKGGQIALPVEINLDNHGVQLRTFDEMGRFCKAVVNSGLAPKGFQSPEAVMVAIQHGLELGLAPLQALNSIAIINGKPSVYGDSAWALVKRHPDFEDAEETGDANERVCMIKRRGQTAVVRKFSMTDAKRAGLSGKPGPWTQYPERMLQMRARAFAMRDAFPDALKGVGITEEVRDYAEPRPVRGRVIDSSVVLPGEAPKTAAEYFESAVDTAAKAAGLEELELVAEVAK